MTSIIAITGMMGSGKSTLAHHAAAAIPDCIVVEEDDFNSMTERSLLDIEDWWNRGGDVSEFDLSTLVTHLGQMCPHRLSAHVTSSRGSSPGIVLLETQFGRLHPALQPWIDRQVWIDVPADVALTRKLAKIGGDLLNDQAAYTGSHGLEWITGFCRGYLATTRKLFEMQRTRVRACSDLDLDGMLPPEHLIPLLVHELSKI